MKNNKTDLETKPTKELLMKINGLATKIKLDYANPDGNGIDQDEANDLATMILEFNEKLSKIIIVDF